MKSAFAKIFGEMYYAFMLLRLGGLKVFLKQLRCQIYSRSAQVGFTVDLQRNDIPRIEAKINYTLSLASEQDMNEILQKTKTESEESVQSLVYRRWLYEDGYHNWYIARTADTNELCFMQSVIHPEDDKVVKGRFKGWFPKLKEDEILLEGAYAFEKYRGCRLCDSVASDILDIYRKKGFKRMITYIKKDNVTSLKAAAKTGFTKFEEVPIHKILFFTRSEFSASKDSGELVAKREVAVESC